MEQTERINKYLSRCGVCSRREADALIAAGRVTIDGRIAVPGDRVSFRSDEDAKSVSAVAVDGVPVRLPDAPVLLMLNKPAGIVCTAEPREPHNVVKFVDYPVRIYPVGRLDKDSRGLLLLTNRGDITQQLTHARHGHEKEYRVTVNRPVTADFLARIQRGVRLPELDVTTAPCRAWKTAQQSFAIVLQEGRNRQIRRMCQALGYRVTDLCRVRIAGLELGDLPEGQWRKLTPEEEAALAIRRG